MAKSHKTLFCGPPGIGLNQIFGTKNVNDVYSYFEDNYVIYVHKGRIAIILVYKALDLGLGDEILAPAYNCSSEIDALLSTGVSIILYKIDRSTSIDLSDIEKKLHIRQGQFTLFTILVFRNQLYN